MRASLELRLILDFLIYLPERAAILAPDLLDPIKLTPVIRSSLIID
jgi:hypothetical protein